MLGIIHVSMLGGCEMENSKLDHLLQQFATRLSRRTGLRLLSGLGMLGLVLPETAETRKKKKKKRKKHGNSSPTGCRAGTKQCGSECIPNGNCCTTGDCTGTNVCENGTCAALRCGNGGACTVFLTNAGSVGTALGGLNGAYA